jgi:hypothetical protein
MDNPDRTQKTWLCTVVFLDIVGYSKEPVAQQMGMKERLNEFIPQTIAQVVESDISASASILGLFGWSKILMDNSMLLATASMWRNA